MAAADNLLFNIDVIVADGKPVAIEGGTAMLSGAHRYEFKSVPAALGKDAASRTRVPTTLKAKILFTNTVSPDELAAMNGVQITARDTQSGRRVLLADCAFSSLGDIGGGSVDITWLVLSPPQWL